jgi:hypothetical protein
MTFLQAFVSLKADAFFHDTSTFEPDLPSAFDVAGSWAAGAHSQRRRH